MPSPTHHSTLSSWKPTQTRQRKSHRPQDKSTNPHPIRIRLSHQQRNRQHPMPHLRNENTNKHPNTQGLHSPSTNTQRRQRPTNTRRPKPLPQTLRNLQVPRQQKSKNISQLHKPSTPRPKPTYKGANIITKPQSSHLHQQSSQRKLQSKCLNIKPQA